MTKKDFDLIELERLLNCKIVGIVRATKPLAYDGEFKSYYGLKIDNPIMEEGYILWLVGDSVANFVVENFDIAEEFEEV
jgi:hypothetical protein